MKKIALVFTALCTCMLFSCKQEIATPQDPEITPESGMQTVTITASIAETKTSYSESGSDLIFSWTAGDQISVLCTDGNFYTFTANSTAATTTFTGVIPDGVSLGSYAFFPADAGHTYSGLKFSIPEEKDLTSHMSADMPMVGDKGDGNAYSFMHCSGALKFTLANIPSEFVSVKISFVSASLKLSGLFGVFKSSEQWRWNAAGGSTVSEKTFTRKVRVTNHTAEVYLPYAWGANMWANNTVTIKAYDSSDNEYAIITDKTMKGDGSYNFVRAHVRPLTPLILNNLERIDWSDAGVATSTLDDWQTSTVGLTELKATADNYYLYLRAKGPSSSITESNYMDVYLSDGAAGDYVYHDYWLSTGSVFYKQEHKGSVTSSSLTMKFNDISVDTRTEADGDDIYWSMALPRSAHDLILTSGTVYVGVSLWQSWDIIGCIPSRRTWDHESYLMEVTLP